jgi:RNA polymerase sigma factor (sigma-70 family)
MQEKELLPHLFRMEYRKMISVLCSLFGIDHIEIAEDIVSDTFLLATELWSIEGIPENPAGWLYTVAKNKTLNHLKRNSVFAKKVSSALKHNSHAAAAFEIDLSVKNIDDSQLAMIFTICNPVISADSQIALALSLLCGFGIQEIADAFLTNKEVVYKRLNRAKEKLKEQKIRIEQPNLNQINDRLETVLTTLYLMFSEGYYSTSQNTVLRKDVCAEAMRLMHLLIENENTNRPPVNALYALMCFHASRFEARLNSNGDIVLYDDQDATLWDNDLINKGIYYLNKAASGNELSKYHLEGGIAYWHTIKEDSHEKWENILQLYNQLLILEYSPIAALNRTYALSKTKGKEAAILEAEKLKLETDHFYHSLLGNLYTGIDNKKALQHYEIALRLASTVFDRAIIIRNIERLSGM